MEGDVFTLNDIFQLEYEGEDLDGRLRTRYRVSRARPSFHGRLAYFGTDVAWNAALEEAAQS